MAYIQEFVKQIPRVIGKGRQDVLTPPGWPLKNDLSCHNLSVEDVTELALDSPLWRLEVIGSKRSYTLKWCKIVTNNDDELMMMMSPLVWSPITSCLLATALTSMIAAMPWTVHRMSSLYRPPTQAACSPESILSLNPIPHPFGIWHSSIISPLQPAFHNNLFRLQRGARQINESVRAFPVFRKTDRRDTKDLLTPNDTKWD